MSESRKASRICQDEDLLPVIADIRAAGRTTPQQIANALNERDITAARGGPWAAAQFSRVLIPHQSPHKAATVQQSEEVA
jgi:hypothetical protein